MKGNALILLSNGKIQPNTSRNLDEKKMVKLFIWWGSSQCILVKRMTTSQMNFRLPRWTEAWEKFTEPLVAFIVNGRLSINGFAYDYSSLSFLSQANGRFIII